MADETIAFKEDSSGRLALRLALERPDLGEELLDLFFESNNRPDVLLPFFNEAILACDWDRVFLFLKVCPEVLQEKDAEGRLPLHILSGETDSKLDVCGMFLTIFPDACRKRNPLDDRLPLHQLAARNNWHTGDEYCVDIEILTQLAEATYPRQNGAGGCPTLLESAKGAIWTDFSRLLAHAKDLTPAAFSRGDPGLLEVLRQSKEQDETLGYTALHYCILYNAPVRLVEKLIRISKADDKGTCILDLAGSKDGMLPIETAVTCGANTELWTALWAMSDAEGRRRGNLATACLAFKNEHWSMALSAFSGDTSISQFKYNGAFPLHYACAATGCPPVVILEMLQERPQGNPEAASALDSTGKLPLQHALDADQPLEVLEDLLKAFDCPLLVTIAIAKQLVNGDFSKEAALEFQRKSDARFQAAHERNAARLDELQNSGASPDDIAAAATILRNMEEQRKSANATAAKEGIQPPASVRVIRYVRASPAACFEWLLPHFYRVGGARGTLEKGEAATMSASSQSKDEDVLVDIAAVAEHWNRRLPIHIAAEAGAPASVLQAMLAIDSVQADILLPETREIPFEIAERVHAPAETLNQLAVHGPAWTLDYLADQLHQSVTTNKWSAALRYLNAFPNNAAGNNHLGRTGNSEWESKKAAHTSFDGVPPPWGTAASTSECDDEALTNPQSSHNQSQALVATTAGGAPEDIDDEFDVLNASTTSEEEEAGVHGEEHCRHHCPVSKHENTETREDASVAELPSANTPFAGHVNEVLTGTHTSRPSQSTHAASRGLEDVDDLERNPKSTISEFAPLIQFLLHIPPPPVSIEAMAVLRALIEAFPEAVCRDIQYHRGHERVKAVRLRTALEICICSTACDAPVLELLLDWHCRLVGARETFVGQSAPSVAVSGTNSQNNRFSTLLHWAIKAKATNWLTNELIRAASRHGLAEKLCNRQDETGHTPLHLAIMMNSAPDVVQTLLETCPACISVADDFGHNAMHLAAQHGALEEVLKILHASDPSLIAQRDARGRTPMHLLCQNPHRATVSQLRCLISLDPSVVHVPIEGDDVTKTSPTAAPDPTDTAGSDLPSRVLTDSGMLPLHFLAREGVSGPLYDELASATHPPGSVPSLLQCARAGLWHIFRRRILDIADRNSGRQDGAAVRTSVSETVTYGPDSFRPHIDESQLVDAVTGQNVLHFAAACGCPTSTLTELLALLPRQLILQRDALLRSPVHIAAMQRTCPAQSVIVLARAAQTEFAAREAQKQASHQREKESRELIPPLLAQDKENKTPLHWAIDACRQAVVIHRLLRLDPRAAALCSWAGDSVAHSIVRTALSTPEAVVHANATIFDSSTGEVRKPVGRSHDEMLELLHQILELYPAVLNAYNTAGDTVFSLAMKCWNQNRPDPRSPTLQPNHDRRSHTANSPDEAAMLRYIHLLWICDPWVLSSDDVAPFAQQFAKICGGSTALEALTTQRITQRLLVAMRSGSSKSLPAIVALRELIPDSRGSAPLLRLQRRLTRQTDTQAQLSDASCIAHESSPAIKFLRLCNTTLLRGIALERILVIQRGAATMSTGAAEDPFKRDALVRIIDGGSQSDSTERSAESPAWLGLFWNVAIAPCLVFVDQELTENFLKLNDKTAPAGALTRRQELRSLLSRHQKALLDAFRAGCVPRGWNAWLRARNSQDELLASAVDEFVETEEWSDSCSTAQRDEVRRLDLPGDGSSFVYSRCVASQHRSNTRWLSFPALRASASTPVCQPAGTIRELYSRATSAQEVFASALCHTLQAHGTNSGRTFQASASTASRSTSSLHHTLSAASLSSTLLPEASASTLQMRLPTFASLASVFSMSASATTKEAMHSDRSRFPHGGGGFQFHPRSAALIQSLPPVPSLASIENAYQADLAKRGTAHANAAQAEKMKVQHCRFELYGPELMSIEQLQRAVHRAVHESAQRHNSKTTGTTAAEIEASIVSRLTDAMVATLVVDAEVGPAVQLNAPHDHQTSFDFSSSDESDEHEDAGPQQFGELGLPPSQLAFEAVVDGVVQALEANPALSLQRIGAAARALHLKGHRVDFRHLAIDENAKALLLEAAQGSLRFTTVDLAVAGCGQFICTLQIVHRSVWDALHNALTPADLYELEQASFLLTEEDQCKSPDSMRARSADQPNAILGGKLQHLPNHTSSVRHVETLATNDARNSGAADEGSSVPSPLSRKASSPRMRLNRAKVRPKRFRWHTCVRKAWARMIVVCDMMTRSNVLLNYGAGS
eukprot:INCI3619.5.p1 GENE.INCI3619.5~~INCI3619.5.p1  ORF type:complete len:2479 (+),score=381.36 INCI3619.5:687-7439(+)